MSDKKIKKKFEGVVVSDKGDKTIVVSVGTIKVHPIYKKRYRRDKRYLVHDEENKCKVGDKVAFTASRPMSKRKKWSVI